MHVGVGILYCFVTTLASVFTYCNTNLLLQS